MERRGAMTAAELRSRGFPILAPADRRRRDESLKVWCLTPKKCAAVF
jgi:hypothetical protein